MSELSGEQWHAVSGYLEEALDVPVGDRLAWLARFREEHPALAADLETLLEEQDALRRERFLEQAPPSSRSLATRPATVGLTAWCRRSAKAGWASLARGAERRPLRSACGGQVLNVALAGRGEERFTREGAILGRLVHPNIAQLVDAGVSASGAPYLILEHVDGQPIDRSCEQHRPDLAASLRLFLEVLNAVAHAHANLIVHRDLKPSNVLVDREGM